MYCQWSDVCTVRGVMLCTVRGVMLCTAWGVMCVLSGD